MVEFKMTRLPGVMASLAWRGDSLVDWVGGGDTLGLDGSRRDRCVRYAHAFDAVVDCAPFSVIYERRGTKGLLLRDGKILRELDRSFYHARAYHYPVALWRTAAGRVLLAHCPGGYERLDLEDAETGAVLTRREAREPADVFHSDLAASPGGRYLASAGWVWHPFNVVQVVSVAAALEDPTKLDRLDDVAPDAFDDEALSCAWQSDTHLIVAREKSGLEVHDVARARCISRAPLAHAAGPMMAVDEGHVVTFHGHPRLVRLADGAVVAEWPELPGARAACSIALGVEGDEPPLALDPARRRFAVARPDEVVVVEIAAP